MMEVRVKQILFIRHAKVAMDSSTPICSASLKAWEEAYNHAPITGMPEDEELSQKVRDADYRLCSTLGRAIASMELLGASVDEKNPLFNEAAIPALQGRWLTLKPTHWLVVFRILSLLGIGRWARMLQQSRRDAHKGAQRLLELSQEYETIVLMGHGVMNWLIRKELQKQGWKREGKESHGNWGTTLLVFPVT